eukprot:EG_transcript_13650
MNAASAPSAAPPAPGTNPIKKPQRPLPLSKPVADELCHHLPHDTCGQFLKKYIEYLMMPEKESRWESPSTLYFLLYFLAITLTMCMQLGLLVIVSVALRDAAVDNAGEVVVVTRVVVLLVVFLRLLTGDIAHASILFRVVDVLLACGVGRTEEKGWRARFVAASPLLITTSLAAFQYAMGLGVFWLSYVLIGSSPDTLSTISNALVVTFVEEVNEYMVDFLRSQEAHLRLAALVPANRMRRVLVLTVLAYALFVLLFPLLLSVLFITLWTLSMLLLLLGIIASRETKRKLHFILDFVVFYSCLPTLLFVITAFLLPGVTASAWATLVAVLAVLFLHGLGIMLPVLRHMPASVVHEHKGCRLCC